MFLELDKKYRLPEQWSVLPFELEDPYKRVKNGPPLVNVIYKAKVEWLSRWIANPKKVVANAKMPNLGLDFDEIKAVIVFLSSIAENDVPQVTWDEFLLKKEDDLSEDEYDKMDKVYNAGKGVWGRARCTICHPIKGVGGNVGVGPDLGEITTKINRNWLHSWLGNTKSHFPDTMMAQYRFTDQDVRWLVEFIMRDTQFVPEEKDDEASSAEPDVKILTEKEFSSLRKDASLIEKGRDVVEKARCFVCHDIKGISELMPVVERKRDGLDAFEKLLYDIRCLTCHRIQDKGGTYAPNLTFAGSKIKMTWENEFLQSPDIIRPLSQQMPKFNLNENEAKAATEYIEKNLLIKESLPDIFKDAPPTAEIIAAGEKLFYEKGCNTCHAENITKGGGVVGPNLATVGDRLQSAYILYHLKNPQRANPQGVEPNFGLSDEELKLLVGFLMDHVKKKEGK
ncbi:MAG: c-type cytochrome [Planctomycetia bacterium]|nr:c-type cytochrome [Candidatus Brocadia sp.]QOJ07720.1 MAG: c-type cytochrome [Planctomycetia bacterium]HQU31479.1 c-type cytochrome [Candidatus Brocadia sapporoensis]